MIHLIKKWGARYRGELIFSLASYTTPIVGLLASLLTAKFLAPHELGSIQAVMLILPYAGFLQLGVINGLNRNLAFYMGRGDLETAQRMINAVAFVVKIVSVVGFLIGLAVLSIKFMAVPASRIEVFASIALISSLVFVPQNLYLAALFRSGQHFQRLGQLTLTENVARAFYAFLPAVFGWLGRIAGETVRPIIGFVLRRKYRPYKPDGAFSFQDIKQLLHAGTPLLVNGYLHGLFSVADQSLIALHFNKEQLGYYGLSRLIVSALMIVPTTMAAVLYPKASNVYGRKGNPIALRGFFWKALVFNFIVLVPVCLLAYFLIDPIVKMFLPNYVSGLGAAKVNILTCLTLISSGPSVIAGVLKKVYPILVFYAIALGLMWGLGQYLCLNGNPSIVDIAWIRFFVATGLGITVVFYNHRLTSNPLS